MSETAKALADIISRKMTNSTALTAVVEVKVETSFVGLDQRGTGRSYLLAAAVAFVGLVLLSLLAALALWYVRTQRSPPESPQPAVPSVSAKLELAPANQEADKSNNQNRENLRRYRNPLRDNTELSELDQDRTNLFKAPSLVASKNTNQLCEAPTKEFQKNDLLPGKPLPASRKLFEPLDDAADSVVVLV